MASNGIQEDLRRELGFWDALTIGAGTMIGAGIFLLSGVALQLSGPAAILSFLLAGVVCMITAASAAELATGMPTSGGDYYFVSRSLGPALGAISGIGIWLSLTFAIAFYLFGMGEYLSRFLPITPFWAALAGGAALTALNVVGARESGRTQVVLVLLLLVILGGFAVYGAARLEPANLIPFFPHGTGPILPTTALVFVSFLGFVKIAAVAEEIREPEKNLPRALIGSVALVTLLYVLILVVIGGLFPQERIHEVDDPLVSAARILFGTAGGVVIVLAGLLATLSSANASIMASSRINLAMARDRLVPNWLAAIHQRLMTPHRAILLTGALAAVFLLLDSLEDLAKIASSLQLYSYAALNIGCVMLRTAGPDWYRPTFRTPGSPFLQVAAALACVAIILVSGPFAQIAVVGLILVSLAWYFAWGRSRMEVEHGLGALRIRVAELGTVAFFRRPVAYSREVEVERAPVEPPLGVDPPRQVLVALANPAHGGHLLHLGRLMATGSEEGGSVRGIHFIKVPLQTPLSEARQSIPRERRVEESIIQGLEEERAFVRAIPSNDVDEGEKGQGAGSEGGRPPRRPLEKTPVEVDTDVTHDVARGLLAEVDRRRSDLLLMGWQGSMTVGRIYRSPVQRIMSHVPADLAILKDRGLGVVRSIVVPWGGGIHARLGVSLAARIGLASQARLTVLRLVREGVDPAKEEAGLRRSLGPVIARYPGLEVAVQPADSVGDGILEYLEPRRDEVDLAVIGASRESRIRNFLFGSIPDMVADQAPCSVLMVHRYLPEDWALGAADQLKRVKERMGVTTSPDETPA
jgi:amino acid transporter/nucleotide-binding universal stress UspA family protein